MVAAPDDRELVEAVNSAFYAALESRDTDAMAEVWERSERAVCVHPGWPQLRGWAKVIASWDAIFRNTAYIQFVLTEMQVVIVGDTAWIALDENILQTAGSDELSGSQATATNVFVRARDGDGWCMVVHHSSPVAGEG